MAAQKATDEDRRVLRLSAWPEIDQADWNRAFEQRGRPRRASEGGALPKPASIGMYQEACGRFLGYLQRQDRLDPVLPLADQVIEENLEEYYRHLLACGCAGYTILNYFNQLRLALERMHPGRRFKHITHPNGIPLRQRLDLTKRDIKPPELDELIAWAKELYASGLLLNGDQRRRVQIRDAVLFGVLCEAGPRLRSVTAMRAGVHLQQRGEAWWLVLEPKDAKMGKALRVPLKPWVWPMIERYLTVERNELLRGRSHDALWIDWVGGKPLDERGVDKRVRWRSEKRFGTAFGPHMFRYSIATDAASKPDGDPFGGAARLGHADPNTTIGYTHGTVIAAMAKRHAGAIGEARRLTEALAARSYGPDPGG
jgi:integrase